jgi:hypothetical protein
MAACLVLLLCLYPMAALAAADFYVSTAGNDGWSGHLAQPNAARSDGPFATITRARDAIRALKRNGLDKDLLVHIREGVYGIDSPLLFTSEDSATTAHSITYAAYPGEHPVISGGRELRGWKPGRRGRWTLGTAPGPAFRQLFIDGQRRPRARTPNEGFFRIEKAFGDDRDRFQFSGDDIRNWVNLPDVELVLFYDWEIARGALARVDEANRVVFFAHPIGNLDDPMWSFNRNDAHQRYYLENALEFIDNPGEWYLDRRTGLLTYFAMRGGGEDLLSARTVAAITEQLLLVKGTLDAPVRNLRFDGLRFEHAAFPLPAQGYAGIQAGHYASRGAQWNILPAAIELEAAAGCRIENCRILRTGASAVGLRRGCQQNVIAGNEIADTGGNGIQIGEPAGEKQEEAANPNPANRSVLVRGNVVSNNHIHHTGQEYFGAVGIWIGFAQNTTVDHNLLHDLPYTGISVGWDWGVRPTPCRENRIEYNHIHHVLGQLSDGGGIYTLGWQPGTVLRGNLIHDTDRLHGRADQNGIFFDQGSKGYLVEDNIIFRTPGGGPIRFNLNEPSWHTFRNNSFGVLPDDPRFPVEKARRAGCSPCGSMYPIP